MEEWEFDFEWLKVRHIVKSVTRRKALPDLNGILLMIGIQELGRLKSSFSKEEKQDLMHIAVCQLLSADGYYRFVGRDEDGWPHYAARKALPKKHLKEQDQMLKEKICTYFDEQVESDSSLDLSVGLFIHLKIRSKKEASPKSN